VALCGGTPDDPSHRRRELRSGRNWKGSGGRIDHPTPFRSNPHLAWSSALDLSETLGERACRPLVPEHADPVDGAFQDGVRKRWHAGALDEEDRVSLVRELVKDLALPELLLDGLLVVGFHDDPWGALHGLPPFGRHPKLHPPSRTHLGPR